MNVCLILENSSFKKEERAFRRNDLCHINFEEKN